MGNPNEIKCNDRIKEAAMASLGRVVDPLVDLMFDTGITIQEFERLVRHRAIRAAAARIVKESGRANNSRVSILTGLARGEVARALQSTELPFDLRVGQNPARKVLAGWYNDRRFLDSVGYPAILPIFGSRRTFEQLVGRHGSGIPVRAMLDQLCEIGAVEVLNAQKVRAKARVPVFKGMTVGAVSNFGDRTGDLLRTLKHNLHTASAPIFEGTATVNDVDIGSSLLVRRQLAEQGSAFIETANSLLNRSQIRAKRKGGSKPAGRRLGVTVYCFEDNLATDTSKATSIYKRRKNYQRKSVATVKRNTRTV